MVNDVDNLDISEFTIAAWVKIDTVNNSNMPIVWKGNTVGSNVSSPYTLLITGNSELPGKDGMISQQGTISGTVYPGKVGLIITDSVVDHYILSEIVRPLKIFSHIAVNIDRSKIRIYINGLLDSTTKLLVSPFNGIFPLQIGGVKEGRIFFNGVIDDLRIYNRALSESEIQQLYQGCKPSIDIILNSNNRTTGDRVVINAQIKGSGSSDSSCEPTKVAETIWVKLPNDAVIPLIEPFTVLTLLPGDDIDTKIFEHTFSGVEPIGSYQIGGRLLHPFSGDAISTDIEVLTFSQ